MFKKFILIALLLLVILAIAGWLSGKEQPADPTAEEKPTAPITSPAPETTPPVKETPNIPEFTVDELFALHHKDASRFDELKGKTIRVKGPVRTIEAYEAHSRPQQLITYIFYVSIIEENPERRPSSKLVKTNELREHSFRGRKGKEAKFVSGLIKQAASVQEGDKVILEGTLQSFYKFGGWPEPTYRFYLGEVIQLEIKKIEKVS